MNDTNYQKYRYLSYSHSGVSVNIKKVTAFPISVSVSGAKSCLYVNSVGGGGVDIDTSGSQNYVGAYSNKISTISLDSSGSQSTYDLSIAGGINSAQISGSQDNLNFTSLGGSTSVGSSGSFENIALKTGKFGDLWLLSSGSHNNVSTTGGTASETYIGSQNKIGLNNELISAILCIGSKNALSNSNSTVLFNGCRT